MRYGIRIIRQGDRYGRNDALTHDDPRPMVEFYDADYAGQPGFDIEGQFVSRYYVETLLADRARLAATGLDLQGDVAKWKLTGPQMAEVFAQLDAALA